MNAHIDDRAGEHHQENAVAVAVITPAGIFPSEADFRREAESMVIEHVLKMAAKALGLTNTSDWVAHVHDRKLEPHRTFREECLHGIVEIHWHKHEGGGGA